MRSSNGNASYLAFAWNVITQLELQFSIIFRRVICDIICTWFILGIIFSLNWLDIIDLKYTGITQMWYMFFLQIQISYTCMCRGSFDRMTISHQNPRRFTQVGSILGNLKWKKIFTCGAFIYVCFCWLPQYQNNGLSNLRCLYAILYISVITLLTFAISEGRSLMLANMSLCWDKSLLM